MVRDSRRDAEDGKIIDKGIELGAKNYDVNSYLDGEPAVDAGRLPIARLQRARDGRGHPRQDGRTQAQVSRGRRIPNLLRHDGLRRGVDHERVHTLIEAFILVFIVVLVFLQNWRATIIPMVAVPVSLIGTFAVMAMLGFSLNNLSLFGLVLAIGIVVDDAIVVVENVERWLAEGLSPRDAARKAMDEVTGPVIAIALVLCAVFVPTAFMAGISGAVFQAVRADDRRIDDHLGVQFVDAEPGAVPHYLLKPHGARGETSATAQQEALPRRWHRDHRRACSAYMLPAGQSARSALGIDVGGHVAMSRECGTATARRTAAARSVPAIPPRRLVLVGIAVGWAVWLVNRLLGAFFRRLQLVLRRHDQGLRPASSACLRISVDRCCWSTAGLMGLTYLGFQAVPVGFIPEQDKGYLVLNAQLPDGASLDRTDTVVREMSKIAREPEEPGVAHTIDLPGYSAVLGTNISNVGGMFVILEPFEERKGDAELSAPGDRGQAAAEIRHDSRRRRSACSARRRSKASAPPAASSCRCRTAAAPACARCRGRSKISPTKETAIRGWPDCSAASASPSRSSSSRSTREGQGATDHAQRHRRTLQAYLGRST